MTDDTLLDGAAVAAYLRNTPDFFSAYPELVPDAKNSIVIANLIKQRQKNEAQKQEIDWIVRNVQNSQFLGEKIKELSIALIELALAQKTVAFSALEDVIKAHFSFSHAYLWGTDNALFSALLSAYDTPQCILAKTLPTPLQVGFDVSVLSLALVPIYHQKNAVAYLILGDENADTFAPDKDVFFVKQLAALLQPFAVAR